MRISWTSIQLKDIKVCGYYVLSTSGEKARSVALKIDETYSSYHGYEATRGMGKSATRIIQAFCRG